MSIQNKSPEQRVPLDCALAPPRYLCHHVSNLQVSCELVGKVANNHWLVRNVIHPNCQWQLSTFLSTLFRLDCFMFGFVGRVLLHVVYEILQVFNLLFVTISLGFDLFETLFHCHFDTPIFGTESFNIGTQSVEVSRQGAKLLFQKACNPIHGQQFMRKWFMWGTCFNQFIFIMSLSKSGVYGESISYFVHAFLLSCKLLHRFAKLEVEEDDIAIASR